MVIAEVGLIAGLGSALFAAATGLLVKGVGARIPPISLNAWRCTVASIVFIPIWLAMSHSPLPMPIAIFWTVLSVVFSIVIGDTAFFFAIRNLGVSKATPIAKSYPIFAVIFSLFLLGEPLGGIKLVGVILAIVGTTLMSQRPRKGAKHEAEASAPISGDHWKGVLLALVTAISWGMGAVVLRYSLTRTDINTTNVLRTASGALMLWTIASQVDHKPIKSMVMDRNGVILIVATGMSLVGATLLTVYSVALVGAGTASVYTAAAPLFAVPLGVFLFKEKMGILALVGCLFAIVGVFCVSLA